jgi:hypothetical protein
LRLLALLAEAFELVQGNDYDSRLHTREELYAFSIGRRG